MIEETYKIINDKDRKLSLDELKQVIRELKEYCEDTIAIFSSEHNEVDEAYVKGYSCAYITVLGLLDRLDCNTESDLEKRVKALEDYNNAQREAEIEKIKAENDNLYSLIGKCLRSGGK